MYRIMQGRRKKFQHWIKVPIRARTELRHSGIHVGDEFRKGTQEES